MRFTWLTLASAALGAGGPALGARAMWVAAALIVVALPCRARCADAPDARQLLGMAEPGVLSVILDNRGGRARTGGELPATPKERLAALAERLDFRVEWPAPTVAVLRRRFKDREGRPQFAQGEMRTMVGDILATFPAGSPSDGDWGPPLRDLAAAFTPGQVDVLRTRGRLTPADLSPPQQALLARAAAARAVDRPRAAWERLARLLDRLEGAVLALEAPHAGAPAGVRGTLILHIATGSGQGERLPLAQCAGNPIRPEPPGPPPADVMRQPDGEPDRNPAFAGEPLQQPVYPPRGSATLAGLLRQVSQKSNPPLTLDAALSLADRRVSVSALGTRATTLMKALASLGDWTWEDRGDGAYRLRPLRPAEKKALAGSPVRGLACMPRDLATWLELRDIDGKPTARWPQDAVSRAREGIQGVREDLEAFGNTAMRIGDRLRWLDTPLGFREDIRALLVLSAMVEGLDDEVAQAWRALPPTGVGMQVYLEGEVLMVGLPAVPRGRIEFGFNIMRDGTGRIMNPWGSR